MVAFGLPYSWQQPCASHPCPASTGRRGPSQTAGLVGRAPDTAYVVYHMSYCHEMCVCQNCFLLVACGKLTGACNMPDTGEKMICKKPGTSLFSPPERAEGGGRLVPGRGHPLPRLFRHRSVVFFARAICPCKASQL